MRSRRTYWFHLATALTALSVAACGSQGATHPVAGKSKLETPKASSTSPIPSPSVSSGSAHLPVCQASQLRVAIVWSAAAAGTVGGRIGFTNKGRTSCRLKGWPTLTAVTAAGRSARAVDKVTTMFGPNLSRVRVVELKPGGLAEAAFTGGDVPPPGQTRCPASYRVLRIRPPGSSHSFTLRAWIAYYGQYLPACVAIWVSPVAPVSAFS